MLTTLNQIRAHSPCHDGWGKLLRHLGKTRADDDPVSIVTILESNGLDDALWCLRAVDGHDDRIRKLGCDYALMVKDLWDMPPVVEQYLRTQDESLRDDARAAIQATFGAWNAINPAITGAMRDSARAASFGATIAGTAIVAWAAMAAMDAKTSMKKTQAAMLVAACSEGE